MDADEINGRKVRSCCLCLHLGTSAVAVRLLRATLRSFLRDRGHEDPWVSAVVLGVDEVVMNSIQHGDCLGERVEVRLDLSDRELVVEVLDRGQGYPRKQWATPDLPEDGSESGRGLFLTLNAMDEVTFHEREGGGTRVRLVKRV